MENVTILLGKNSFKRQIYLYELEISVNKGVKMLFLNEVK